MGGLAVALEGVTYTYPSAREPALEDVSLLVEYGEFVVVAGPSGGGKSTLCKILAGLVPHLYGGSLKGRVIVDGVDAVASGPRGLAGHVGLVLQVPENQIVNLTVEEELAFLLENLLHSRETIAKRVAEVAEALGVRHLVGRATHTLSSGEAQRVVLGSVLAAKPRVLVLDEPLAHLDPPTAAKLLELLRRINEEEGVTVVVAEHRLSELLRYASRLVVLNRRILYDGNPREALVVLGLDLERAYGIEVPPVARVGRALGLSPPPLSVEEALARLAAVARASGGAREEGGESRTQSRCREAAIVVEDLWYAYDNNTTALRGVTLEICRGDFAAVVGGNGAGKTTLLKHFNGLLKPTRGRVLVFGTDTRHRSVAELARLVGLVFQNPLHYFFNETAYDEVLFTARAMGIPGAGERAREVLRGLGLSSVALRSPYELSVGEQRRVAIASVLVYGPEILVLDEPTAGLDFSNKLKLLNLLEGLWRSGKTVVIATHDVEFIAMAPVTWVILMDRGRVALQGPPTSLFYGAPLDALEPFTPQLVRLLRALGPLSGGLKEWPIEEGLVAQLLSGVQGPGA